MDCVVCQEPFKARTRLRKYCSKSCKYKANRNLNSIESYVNSTHGRAVSLWHNSRNRDSTHSITLEWIKEQLDKGVCAVTGIPFVFSYHKTRSPWAPSLDKIDPSQGYTEENTRVVVWMYNAAKNIFTDSDVMLLASALVNKDGSLKSQTSKRERRK